MDSHIQKGTLGCGVTYYMVTNPVEKGYAHIAVVQRDEPLSAAKRESLDSDFLGRMGIAPGPEGFLSDADGSTVYRFSHIPFYRPEVLDSTLLYAFARVAESRAQQAVVVSGDIDAPELKKKMDIFSMMVPRMLVKENHQPDYVWESSPAPSVIFHPGGEAEVAVTYAGARIPFPYMNTAQALVTDQFGLEFQVLLRHRLVRNLRDAGIPYGGIRFQSLRSADYGGDERYTVCVSTDAQHLDPVMRVVSSTLAEMDAFGVKEDEFTEAKQQLLPWLRNRASNVPSAETYVNRCVANFLYGANLAPYSEALRYFARKNVADSTETRLFNRFSDALLGQLENLTLEYTGAPDSLEKDDALFYYNLAYLYGSVAHSGKDYSWRSADSLGLEVTCPKLRIKSEKAEPISGGLQWTLSNGIRVIFKQIPGSGMFHYAWQLNGGLALVDGLQEGEGGYIADMLSLYDVGGLPAANFRDMLSAGGIGMNTEVNLQSMAIRGDAPSHKLTLLIKALLDLANNRQLSRSEFLAFSRNQALCAPGITQELYTRLQPGFVYSPLRIPAVLNADTQTKAEAFYAERFSRMNDGVLILAGDLDPDRVKRILCRYMGGFRTLRGGAGRRPVEYRPLSGTTTYTEEGPDKGLHILMDAAWPMTTEQFYTANLATQALEKALITHLAGYGFTSSVKLAYVVQPQERFRLEIHCAPVQPEGLPADVQDISAERALTAVRSALRSVGTTPVPATDLKAWKTRLEAQIRGTLATSEGVVSTVLARYAGNKDMTTRYAESISAVTSQQICAFLSAMADGGRIEYIVL